MPGYTQVWRITWPIILANITAPLLGLVDTAVIGNTGRSVDLGAIALGTIIFNFIYWSFGFLRMGTTGFTAQADGAGDALEVRAILGRALLFALGIGALLILLQLPIVFLALQLLGGSPVVEEITRSYVLTRIWGAPASLVMYALMGVMIGLGHSGKLLRVQLLLNGLNIGLDIFFAGVLGWGVPGIALGTVIAEWVAVVYAGLLTWRLLSVQRRADEPFWPRRLILNAARLRRTLSANADILLRTLALLFGFAWFVDQSARFGDTLLAANHILLQFVFFSAYFLDSFAYAAEVLVGRAFGAGHLRIFDRAVFVSALFALATALVLSLAIVIAGPLAIAALTSLVDVRDSAGQYLPFAAIYVLLAVGAFQLDGIFIGATQTRAMRNATLLAVLVFLLGGWLLISRLGNAGLWIAFVVFAVARALTLAAYYPKLRRLLT